MEGPIGEFWRRFPTGKQLHESMVDAKTGEKNFFVVPCHDHNFGHVRFLWAGDTPGPDGRVGWHEKASSPIKNKDGEVIGWHEELDHVVRGNGPDSDRWIPKGWLHEFTLLSATGYHMCFFHNRDPDRADLKVRIAEVRKMHPEIDPALIETIVVAADRVTDVSPVYNGWGKAFV